MGYGPLLDSGRGPPGNGEPARGFTRQGLHDQLCIWKRPSWPLGGKVLEKGQRGSWETEPPVREVGGWRRWSGEVSQVGCKGPEGVCEQWGGLSQQHTVRE